MRKSILFQKFCHRRAKTQNLWIHLRFIFIQIQTSSHKTVIKNLDAEKKKERKKITNVTTRVYYPSYWTYYSQIIFVFVLLHHYFSSSKIFCINVFLVQFQLQYNSLFSLFLATLLLSLYVELNTLYKTIQTTGTNLQQSTLGWFWYVLNKKFR